MKSNLRLMLSIGTVALLAIAGLLIHTPDRVYQWTVRYPYRLDIQRGSYAWLVTPQVCEKDTTLLFDWDSDAGILTVNGARIYPPVEEPSPMRDEERMESIYGRHPIVRELRQQRGSWVEAVEEYNGLIEGFVEKLSPRCELASAGEMSAGDLQREYEDSASVYPYAEIFAPEMGVELVERGFTVYLRAPRGSVPHQYQFERPTRRERSAAEHKKAADAIVREIVGFYRSQPEVPHVVFIGNGGVPVKASGRGEVARIENEVARALRDDTAPGTTEPSAVPAVILRRIVESASDRD
ncbi:MAG: hypothetical protein R6X35_07425 [Candidatus Krumholzibacteriia bacterium]